MSQNGVNHGGKLCAVSLIQAGLTINPWLYRRRLRRNRCSSLLTSNLRVEERQVDIIPRVRVDLSSNSTFGAAVFEVMVKTAGKFSASHCAGDVGVVFQIGAFVEIRWRRQRFRF